MRAIELLGVALWICATAVLGCQQDRFLCGEPQEGDRSKAKTCDGAGEVCICATQRCAKFDPVACPSTRFWYLFGVAPGCVEQTHLLTKLDQRAVNDELSKMCPAFRDETKPCGTIVGGALKTCGIDEVCDCTAHQCAKKGDGCDSGFLYPADQTCMPAGPPPRLADRFTLLCEPLPLVTELYAETCGKVLPDGGPDVCGPNQLCLCAFNACVLPDPACGSGEADYGVRWVRDGGCAPPVKGLKAEFPNQETGLCAGFAASDIPRLDGGGGSDADAHGDGGDSGIGDGGTDDGGVR